MTCGSVDDGKSTLLGRLLYESNNILVDQSQYLSSLNKRYKKNIEGIDYSLLLDGLIDEKEQGITIDIAFKYFVLGNKQFTLIDSPGHKEFTKNMANAATFADAALILIDANKGMTAQTKKHIEIIEMFPNIQKKIICINKLDMVNYSQRKFKKINTDFVNFMEKNNYEYDQIIPISALNGDNVSQISQKTKFYNGPTLLNFLENLELKNIDKSSKSSILKFVDNSTGKRVYHLEIKNVNFQLGDSLTNLYTGESSNIKKIYHGFKEIKSTKDCKNISLELDSNISIVKGDSLLKKITKDYLTDSFKAKIVWFDEEQLYKNMRYKFKFRGKTISGFISKVDKKIINKNTISTVQIELEEKVHVSEIEDNYFLSQLLILNPMSNATAAFGYVVQNLDRGIAVKKRILQNFEHSKYNCLWFTGLPASGKSSIAEALGRKLEKLNIKYYILDGDNLRSSINKDLGFTKEDRIENNRRIAHISKMMFDSGVLPIVTTISPNKDSREFARSLYSENDFSLIYVKASLETCMERDPKNLYRNSFKKKKNVTGLHSEYDAPDDYDLLLDTENLSIQQSVNRLLKILNL